MHKLFQIYSDITQVSQVSDDMRYDSCWSQDQDFNSTIKDTREQS